MGMKHIIKYENLQVRGDVILTARNVHTGEVIVQKYRNVVTTVGKTLLLNRLTASAVAVVGYCALGTGAGVPAAGNTTMFTELVRKAVTTVTVSTNQCTFSTFFTTSQGNGVLTEAGLFNAASVGTMLNHAAISYTKTTSYTLTVDIVLTIT